MAAIIWTASTSGPGAAIYRRPNSWAFARLEVRISAPLAVGASEPESDVAIVDRSAPRPNHPATAALVIEVAVSSQVRDLQEKPRVYAQAGVSRGRGPVAAGQRAGRQ